MAGRDDEIEAGEIQALDGAGKKRQVPAVVPAQEGGALQEAGADRVALELRGDRAREVEEGVDRRLREEAGDRLEHLLAAAHAGQPVVDQRDAAGLARVHRAAAPDPSAFW